MLLILRLFLLKHPQFVKILYCGSRDPQTTIGSQAGFKVNIKIYREKLFLKNRNATVLGITMHPFVAIIDS